jgi:activator of HSP90 ATPase
MARTIIQRIFFKKISPKQLYETYMDSKKHAAATGSKAVVQNKMGGSFSAFGMLKGRFLFLVQGKTIVQTWRSVKFLKNDEDSILILSFKKVKGGARVDLVHAFLPKSDYAAVKKGWPKYYWKPWKKYLSRKI